MWCHDEHCLMYSSALSHQRYSTMSSYKSDHDGLAYEDTQGTVTIPLYISWPTRECPALFPLTSSMSYPDKGIFPSWVHHCTNFRTGCPMRSHVGYVVKLSLERSMICSIIKPRTYIGPTQRLHPNGESAHPAFGRVHPRGVQDGACSVEHNPCDVGCGQHAPW